MISRTYGVIWYKYYDKRNYYTPVMRGKNQKRNKTVMDDLWNIWRHLV